MASATDGNDFLGAQGSGWMRKRGERLQDTGHGTSLFLCYGVQVEIERRIFSVFVSMFW